MKQRWALAALLLLVVSLGALACSGGVSARGWAAPVRAGDALLVSTGRGRLDAIDLRTRERSWRFPEDWFLPDKRSRGLRGIYATPIFSSDGRTLFVGDYNGYLYALRPAEVNRNARNDKEQPVAGSLKLGGPIIGGIVLDQERNSLIVTAGERVFRVSASELTQRIDNKELPVTTTELFRTGGDIWSAPLLRDGRIFVASLDGNLYAIDAATGGEVWRFTATSALVSTPVVAGSTLLVGGFDDRLHAVDIASGSERWQFKAASWIWSAPLVDGSRVYVGDFDGKLYALDLANGAVVWSLDLTDQPIVASPALVRGVLLVASQGGQIYGIDPSTQAQRWPPVDVQAAITADFLVDDANDANAANVYLAPNACVQPPGGTSKSYYISLDPSTGALSATGEVC